MKLQNMRTIFQLLLLSLLTIHSFSQTFKKESPLAHTFSIVARDDQTGEMAVAVQSHWFSVGTIVSWGEAGVGVIATQSFVNVSFGTKGLDLLRRGLTAAEALDILLKEDEGREVRQVAIIDTNGNVATHTGKMCIQYASHIQGKQFSVQANMMLGNEVCQAMSKAFEGSAGKPLAERLMLSIEAAQGAGGDIRGKQSAALLVVRGKSTGKPWEDRTVDLRVDDHKEPIKELRRLLTVHKAYEHMNAGDLAVEKNDMAKAMEQYQAAMNLMPGNLEMQYWTGITLANNKQVDKAIPILKKVFAADKNWKTLTRRLPSVNLLTVPEADLQKILAL
jgi:uncharacterized Ntn-hydrolase superfamily protein